MTSVDILSEDVLFDLLLSDKELEVHRKHITTLIEDAVEIVGADGTVIGLSGGIDSTLTAFLAAEVFGKESLHGLVVPSVANGKDMMSDAEGVTEMLGTKYDVVEIQPIAETFFDTFPEAVDDRMVAEDVYVRTRTVPNYFVTNYENRITPGTGNRAEAMIDHLAKYDDQAVDCSPIGNLYKQQIHQLATHVGVPESLMLQTSSAKMQSGQTDKDELGLTYDALDAILALHVDGLLSKSATIHHLSMIKE